MSHPIAAFAGPASGPACFPVLANIDRAFERTPGVNSPNASIMISRTELGRLILLATEVGSRFSRDGIDYDPAAWMVAPRRLFGGRNAVDACREELPFMRGMLLHSLSCGLDGDPDDFDAIILDRDGSGEASNKSRGLTPDQNSHFSGPELYTAIVIGEMTGSLCHVFHATMAFSSEDVLTQLHERLGKLSEQAQVQRGYDPSHPVACAHVSAAIGELLLDVAADPNSPLGRGLNVYIEHRFAH